MEDLVFGEEGSECAINTMSALITSYFQWATKPAEDLLVNKLS